MSRPFLNSYGLRVADPLRSIRFYERHFGMTLLKERSVAEGSQYTLGLTGSNSLFKTAPYFERGGLLELTHPNGATVENFQASNGNKDPFRGFGHICFSVADLPATCEQLEKDGVKFQKRMSDGRQRNIAFALDPDGYWIELISNQQETETIRLNHGMIRIKDRDLALDFYTKKLGMSLVDISDHPNSKFTLYFLSFDPEHVHATSRALTEGLVELTYNWGTEKDETFKYYNGHDAQAIGFNHFTVAVQDPKKYVEQLQAKGVPLKSQDSDNVFTVMDPDNYYVQIVPQADY